MICSKSPLKYFLSVNIDRDEIPAFSYSFAILTGLYSLIIVPALGLDFLISAIILFFLILLLFVIKSLKPLLGSIFVIFSRVFNEYFFLNV